MRGSRIAVLAIAVVAVAFHAQEKKKIYSNSYLGKKLPAITAPAENWLNTKKPPVLDKLKGQVVWVEFSFIH